MPKHIMRGKVNSSHTTIIDAASRVIKSAEKLPEVSKIALGPITPHLPPGIQRIKFISITGGIRAEIRGTNSKQQLFIYTSDPLHTQEELSKLF